MLDAIERHRCTIFAGVPTMYFELLRADLAQRDLSSLRRGVSGGDAIPGEVIKAFEEKFPGVVILEGYGLSETASTATFNISAEQRKVRSIGKPIWGVEIRVVDDGRAAAPAGGGERRRDRHPRTQRDEGVLQESRGDRPRRSAAAGSIRATSPTPMRTVICSSSTGRRTSSSAAASTSTRARSKTSSTATPRSPRPRSSAGPTRGWARKSSRSSSSSRARTSPRDDLVAYCKERLAAYKYPREVRIVAELPKGPTGKILKKELHAD